MTIKRTLFNFLSLPLGLLASVALAWLLIKATPSQSNEGWGAIGDMLAFSVLVLGFSLLFFIGWTIKLVYDLFKFKTYQKFFWCNISVLAIPYSVLIYFLFAFLFEKANQFHQRQSVTIEIKQYDSLLYPENYRVINFVRSADSVLLYMENFDKKNVSTIEYAFYKNGIFQTESRGLFDRLCLFKLENNVLSEIEHPDYNDSLTSIGVNILKIEEPVPCITYGTLSEQAYTVIRDTCQPNKSDTLWGYVTDNHVARNITYTDKVGINYILFCTEPDTYNPTMLFIGELKNGKKRVYKINLSEDDRKYFEPRQIITIFKQKNRFYILCHKKAIWFTMEKLS